MRIHRSRNKFSKNRQPFLRARRTRMPRPQHHQIRLRPPVQRGHNVNSRFMLNQLLRLLARKNRPLADTDSLRSS